MEFLSSLLAKSRLKDLHLQNFAKEKGGECLSESYKTNETSYTWRCASGHKFSKLWLAVKVRGAWCLECQNNNGISSLQKFAEERGGKCLSTVYTRGDVDYEFMCKNGHVFSCNWNSLKFGRRDWNHCCNTITIDKLREHAAAMGGKCLSEEFKPGTNIKFTWQCSEGHIWDATWTNVGYGNRTWCKQCLLWSQDQIESEIKKNSCVNLEAISGTGIYTKYRITCEFGHIWETNASNIIYNKTWCLECQKLSLEIARKEAVKNGGECLDTEYTNCKAPMTWKCQKGHVFKATINRVRSGNTWCKKCHDDSMRHDISLAHAVAKKKGGICHSTEYVNLETPLTWECTEGHIWDARLGNVMNNTWCNTCVMVKRRQRSLDRVYRWVKLLGGSIVTPREEIPLEIKANAVYVQFRCVQKHIFGHTLQVVYRGTWCPKCRFKSEEKCREIFDRIYSLPFPKKYLQCMKGLELDGYCKELNIAFEYDGKQHTEYVPFFHRNGQADLVKQQERDKYKDELCIANAIALIRIPHTFSYTEPQKLEEYIITQLEECGF